MLKRSVQPNYRKIIFLPRVVCSLADIYTYKSIYQYQFYIYIYSTIKTTKVLHSLKKYNNNNYKVKVIKHYNLQYLIYSNIKIARDNH